jgi:ABC-type glycerol-3-phosphate transport system substrate-binding protein
MDLVKSDGADIEVTYKDQVIFNGYMDIEAETGKDTPHFWYNKVVLDKYGIEY